MQLDTLGWLTSTVGLPGRPSLSEEKQQRREWMGMGDKREGEGEELERGEEGEILVGCKNKKKLKSKTKINK